MTRSKGKAPLAILILVASFLAPTELSLFLGGLRLPPHRVALLILLPIALWRMATDRTVRILTFDVAFLLFNVWTLSVFLHHHGDSEGLQFGGSLALESFGAYLVARAFVRDQEAYSGTVRLLVVAVAISGLVALPETLTGWHYVHDLLGNLTGYQHPIGHETRLGLTRAYGTFDHPIHFGTFAASALALVWFATPRQRLRRKRVATIALVTALGLSSAPLLCLGVQIGLVGWHRLTRGMAGRVPLTLVIIAGLFIGLSLVSDRSPFAFIATGMTFDAWTGYYRLLIWEHGLENVWANPWTGIGLNDWTRPWWMVSASVDAFWLVIAMRSGIPAFLLLAVALALLVHATLSRARKAEPHVRRIAMGWTMSLIGLALIGCTVHFWNVLYAYVFLLVGLSGWIADPIRARPGVLARSTVPRRPVTAGADHAVLPNAVPA